MTMGQVVYLEDVMPSREAARKRRRLHKPWTV